MKERTAIFCLFICLFTGNLQGQQHEITTQSYQSDPTIVSVATPQAASLGKFGRVPVDLFNGLYALSIPVYTLPVKGYPMDIKLSYHSGGIKPNDKGGIVGVGWSLLASGSITRVQHGTLDEHVNPNYVDSLLGYYWNQSQLNISNWDSISAVINLLTQIVCEGSPSGCPANVPQWHDWAPDEFLFNCFGYSGSFWLDNNGKWVIRENSGEKMTISSDFGSYSYKYPTATDSVRMKYTFRKFTITDGHGNIFIFGGDPNSVEFNRNFNDVWPATATSWWLTQVTTDKAETVNFNYQRILPSASEYGGMNCYQAQTGPNNYAFYNLQQLSGVVHDPVYLQSITCNNVTTQFTYATSNIFSYSNSPPLNPNGGLPSGDISTYYNTHATTLPSQDLNAVYPTDYKLTSILVNYGAYSKRYSFSYYDSSVANRLFLKTFSVGPVTRPMVYQFNYNGTSFSSYADGVIYDGLLTTKVDHWGYYTGRFPYKTSDLPAFSGRYYSSYNSYPIDDFINYYYTSRQPNSDSMKVGSLASIIYPTGGYTNFIYEPHDYSSQLNLANNHASFLGSNTVAGGLRIKEIDSYTDPYSPPVIKRYIYRNDNGYSSGVLNSAGVLYKDSVTGTLANGNLFIYKYFFDNNSLPLQNSNGNHVTYSRVDEISGDSSRTVYRYTNHDNGHYDLMPSNFTTTVNAPYWRQNNSRNFQRGLPMSQTAYDSSGNMASKDTIRYINDDSITFNLVGVRAYDFKPKDIKMMSYATGQGFMVAVFQNAYLYSPSVTPFVYYQHYYPQVQKTTTYYRAPDSVQTVETYQYNPNNNKVSLDSLKNLSDGSAKVTTYNYPPDYVAGNSFYSGMINQNVIDPVIQRTTSNQSAKILQVTKDSLIKNTIGSGSYYWLYERDSYRDPTDILKSNILTYDAVGNPVNVVGTDGIPVCYLWDYASMHPVAIVKNAQNNSVAYTSFEAEGSGNWVLPDASRNVTTSMTGQQSYDLTNARTITGNVVAGSSYIVSYWAKGGPAVIKANGTNVPINLTGLTKNGWTYYEYLLPNTTTTISVTGSSSNTNSIDELRLFPSTAQMTTYTYSPLCGVTSICTPSNGITYYYWDDALNRLLRIQDMDGNIVRQFEYHYQELSIPVYNTPQSGTFTRRTCAVGGTPSTVTYTVPAGRYRSTISLQDANAQAQNDVTTNGPLYADSVGTCTFYNAVQSKSFTRGNCATGGVPSTVTYTIPAGTYSSTISQGKADTLAINALNAGGQHYADSVGTCTFYNAVQSGNFTRDNCTPTGTPSTVTYTIPAGTYSSTISQGNADTLALNALKAGGPHYADSLGTCTYHNAAQSLYFTKSNCGTGYTGSTVLYTVPAGLFTSTISQGNADTLAINYANSGPGQHYADSVGLCYVTISCTNTAGASGFTATYTSLANPSVVYTFNIPSGGGVIGGLPSGKWKLTIASSSNTTIYRFGIGCNNITTDGTSATFALVPVSATQCNTITISFPQ